MKRLIVAAVLVACSFDASAVGASQEWVKAFVASNSVSVSRADGVKTYSTGMGRGAVSVKIEDATIHALMATNATPVAISLGVTNGMYFVWNEPTHSYTNAAKVIVAETDKFLWNEHESKGLKFDGYFDVVMRLIQPTYAKEVVE